MFPTLIIGPLPANDFLDLVHLRNQYQHLPKHYSITPALASAAKAITLLTLEVTVRPHIDFDWYDRDFFRHGSLLTQHGVLALTAFVSRFRYFGAFKFTQAGIDALAMSYNSETNRFDRFSTADYRYELE
jgi:lysophospholipid acyltransferase